MSHDPIIEELHRIREEHAARFNYDLKAIVADLREWQKASGRTFVSFPPRRPSPEEAEAARRRLYGAARSAG